MLEGRKEGFKINGIPKRSFSPGERLSDEDILKLQEFIVKPALTQEKFINNITALTILAGTPGPCRYSSRRQR